ncbi:MAG: hypothetical protein WCF03_21185 [Nitrososphaeraceae archaeon]
MQHNAYLKERRYGIMNKKYYPRFAKRLRIVIMTSMIALLSLMVVVPNSTGFAYAQSTSAQIQALLAQVSKLKSTVQAQSTQISQLSAALRAGAGLSLSIVTKTGPVVVPAGKIVESHVDCPAGSVPTGGGSDTGADPGDPRLQFIQSGPFTSHGFTATGWKAAEFNPTTTNLLFFVIVQCATITQGTLSR